jgi:hypothetical protein
MSVHRLQYRTVEGGHVINVNVQLPGDEVEQVEDVELSKDSASAHTSELSVEAQFSTGNNDPSHPVSSHLESNSVPTELQSKDSISSDSTAKRADADMGEHLPREENPETAEVISLPVEITIGTETSLELILPER